MCRVCYVEPPMWTVRIPVVNTTVGYTVSSNDDSRMYRPTPSLDSILTLGYLQTALEVCQPKENILVIFNRTINILVHTILRSCFLRQA